MAKCACCGAETILYVNGVPICVDCDNQKPDAQSPPPLRPPIDIYRTPSAKTQDKGTGWPPPVN